MTLKAIKEQFKPGESWHCRREERRPDMGTTNLDREEMRAVRATGATYLTWTVTSTGKKCDTNWPKASEILEARPGFLKFHYFSGGVILTFTKEPAP